MESYSYTLLVEQFPIRAKVAIKLKMAESKLKLDDHFFALLGFA